MSKSIRLWFISATAIALASSLFTSCESNTGKYPEDSFSVLQATDVNGDLVIYTVNMGYKDYRFKKEFPWHLVITVETLAQNQNGHPTDAEAEILNDLEDGIHFELTKVCQAHYIGRSTLPGYREIFYYLDDSAKARPMLEANANTPNPVRRLTFKIEQDEDWKKVDYLLMGD